MNNLIRLFVLFLVLGLATAARAATSLDDWFAEATGLRDKVAPQHIARPDFMCGTTFKTMCKDHYSESALPPEALIFWGILKYDRVHQVGLARSSTDQTGFALFKASPPPEANVPNADLSSYGTGRGLRIGSPYAQVLALYGPPVRHGSHFVTAYTADDVEPCTVPSVCHGKPVTQPETITVVVDNGRVSAITINVELWEP